MNETEIKQYAANLKKPEGEKGKEVAELMNKGNRGINLHTLAALDIQPEDRVLEIGMGNGYFVKNILNTSPSVHYFGVDYSPDMVKMASELNSSFVEEDKACFYEGNAEDLPLEDDAVNKIFTINTLYFWENSTQVLKECRRVLTDNGSLTISVRPDHIMRLLEVTKHGFAFYSKDQIVDMMESNGFGTLQITEIKEPAKKVFDRWMELETLIIQGFIDDQIS